MTEQELKQWQTEVRSKKSAEFGEVGQKFDCRYCGENSCGILVELICKRKICYFYNKKYRKTSEISDDFSENC